jgi:hypothetical protein
MMSRVSHNSVPENVGLMIINDLRRMYFRLKSKIMQAIMRMVQ